MCFSGEMEGLNFFSLIIILMSYETGNVSPKTWSLKHPRVSEKKKENEMVMLKLVAQ